MPYIDRINVSGVTYDLSSSAPISYRISVEDDEDYPCVISVVKYIGSSTAWSESGHTMSSDHAAEMERDARRGAAISLDYGDDNIIFCDRVNQEGHGEGGQLTLFSLRFTRVYGSNGFWFEVGEPDDQTDRCDLIISEFSSDKSVFQEYNNTISLPRPILTTSSSDPTSSITSTVLFNSGAYIVHNTGLIHGVTVDGSTITASGRIEGKYSASAPTTTSLVQANNIFGATPTAAGVNNQIVFVLVD